MDISIIGMGWFYRFRLYGGPLCFGKGGKPWAPVRPRQAGVPSLRHCSAGTRRRAVPGPAALARRPASQPQYLHSAFPYVAIGGVWTISV
ncbi:hypothetical protein PSCICL_21200 [Pseudomonas cichorii]|nr:hypothetical protein PSCICL_21200 [Pseudomonas cichorii]